MTGADFRLVMLAAFGWQVANEKLYGDSNPRVTLDWDNLFIRKRSRGFGIIIRGQCDCDCDCGNVPWDGHESCASVKCELRALLAATRAKTQATNARQQPQYGCPRLPAHSPVCKTSGADGYVRRG
ncbi:hypothetical protein B0T24DRAFT_215133 [Lasiosphaeria ovina]|uniref:Uncharacterized protein n=1 Tax=Lasiosphaeria ovina TaxID=92902 RepID=A0AAE0KFX6_9PEZI|nr:hypothetical protein B0T24DRAFT_215133 [Lasiosphaeria ovina]